MWLLLECCFDMVAALLAEYWWKMCLHNGKYVCVIGVWFGWKYTLNALCLEEDWLEGKEK